MIGMLVPSSLAPLFGLFGAVFQTDEAARPVKCAQRASLGPPRSIGVYADMSVRIILGSPFWTIWCHFVRLEEAAARCETRTRLAPTAADFRGLRSFEWIERSGASVRVNGAPDPSRLWRTARSLKLRDFFPHALAHIRRTTSREPTDAAVRKAAQPTNAQRETRTNPCAGTSRVRLIQDFHTNDRSAGISSGSYATSYLPRTKSLQPASCR